jgi:predicted TIM-barrel fold metal-dependent hydrolase
VYLMPDMYFHGLPGHEMYTAAINTFAADQFLFATAYPSRPLELTVDQYCALPLRSEALNKVCYSTAARLLKLGSKSSAIHDRATT